MLQCLLFAMAVMLKATVLSLFQMSQVEFDLFQALVEQMPSDDPDTDVNMGCLLYKVFSSQCNLH